MRPLFIIAALWLASGPATAVPLTDSIGPSAKAKEKLVLDYGPAAHVLRMRQQTKARRPAPHRRLDAERTRTTAPLAKTLAPGANSQTHRASERIDAVAGPFCRARRGQTARVPALDRRGRRDVVCWFRH